jgi:hypothetical protein
VGSRLGEAREGGVRVVRVVDTAGDDDGRRAVLEQIDLLLEPPFLDSGVGEEVVDRPGDAVALRLAGDHDRVVLEQALHERLVPLAERLPLEVELDLGPEHRVVLGERVVALGLEVERSAARDRVEEERLLDGRDERVADPAEHRVEGPDRQVELAALVERARVVAEVLVGVLGAEAQAGRRRRVDAPAPGFDVRRGDERERLGRPPFRVHEQDAVEDLERLVRVERGDDLRDRVQVPVDELAEPARVVQGARPRAAGDEELEPGRAERVLDVDDDEREPETVVGGGSHVALGPPALGVQEPRRVVDPPDLSDSSRVPVGRQREHRTSLGT